MPPEPDRDRRISEEDSAPQEGRGVRAGARAVLTWTLANRIKAAAIGVACLASVGAVAALWQVMVCGPGPEEAVTLDMALDALDAGRHGEAQELAKTLQERKTLPMDELGGPAFVLGAASAFEAGQAPPKERRERFLVAARWLEEARDRGFPPGRRAEGTFLLGRCLLLAGKIPAGRLVLREALNVNRLRQTEIHGLLAAAFLGDANPKLDEALEENALYLADRRLPPRKRDDALLQRAEILLRMGETAACAAELDKMPRSAQNRGEALVLRGQVLMEEARAMKPKAGATAPDQLLVRQKYEEAIKTLRLAQDRDTLNNVATRKSIYLIGVCFLESGDYRAALGQFERCRKLFAEGPEGMAASLREAELARQLGRDAEALAAYRRVLGAVADPNEFSNPWISLDDLRAEALGAYQHYLDTQGFEVALQLSRLLCPLFPETRALELSAQTYLAWGRSLRSQAEQVPAAKAAELAGQGRERFRNAADVYWRLAQLQAATRQYPDQLWNTAAALMEGQDYRNAVQVLEMYLKDQARKRHPQALVSLGEAYLSLGRTEKALVALQECVDFHPRDAAAYRARLLAAMAQLESGNFGQAESLLRENLGGEQLTPASNEWRDSLFALGKVLLAAGRYEEAAERLDEAVKRYPDVPQALEAEYLIADSYRRGADQARERVRQDLPGDSRLGHTRKIGELLDKALAQYEKVQKLLSKRQETEDLRPLEKAILRNCYFSIGKIYFDRQDYESAVRAYVNATNRYQNCPEVLEAYLQIAEAYRRLDKPIDARSTIEQAKVVLARMKPDVDFLETTNYTREQWGKLLDEMSGSRG